MRHTSTITGENSILSTKFYKIVNHLHVLYSMRVKWEMRGVSFETVILLSLCMSTLFGALVLITRWSTSWQGRNYPPPFMGLFWITFRVTRSMHKVTPLVYSLSSKRSTYLTMLRSRGDSQQTALSERI